MIRRRSQFCEATKGVRLTVDCGTNPSPVVVWTATVQAVWVPKP